MTNPTKIHYVVLLTAGVSLMLVVHVLVVWWAITGGIRSRGSGTTDADEEDGHGSGGLSPGELVTLPCHDFKPADDSVAADCAVCLEAFQAGDWCRQLPRCEHSFHAECVDSWLRKNRACPVCRANVVDQPPKGEAKAAPSGVMEMEERRSSDGILEIVTER